MSQILESLVNVFTPDEYPPDEETGRSEVPFEDILTEVYKRVNSFSVELTQMGYRPDGGPFVGVKITIPLEEDNIHTIVGSADSGPQMGISGVQTLAIKNAFLRNLRMGEALYQSNTIKENEKPVTATEPQVFTPKSQPQTNQGGNKEWDGELTVKQGKWQGHKYKDLPLDLLTQWQQAGIKTASLELSRRGHNTTSSVQTTLNNSPFRNR